MGLGHTKRTQMALQMVRALGSFLFLHSGVDRGFSPQISQPQNKVKSSPVSYRSFSPKPEQARGI